MGLSLAHFLAEQADRADASNHRGVMFLSDAQVRLFYRLARSEGSVNPADNQSVTVDGFQFQLRPVAMRSGGFRLPYHRGRNPEQVTAEHNAAGERVARDRAQTAAVLHFHRTGDAALLEQFVRDFPEAEKQGAGATAG